MAWAAVRQCVSTLPLPCQAGSPTTKMAATPRDSSIMSAIGFFLHCGRLGFLFLLFLEGLDGGLDLVVGPLVAIDLVAQFLPVPLLDLERPLLMVDKPALDGLRQRSERDHFRGRC